MDTTEENQRLVALIKEIGGYADVKLLPDGSVAAIGRLIFTTAVYLGCTVEGWERRFCFEDTAKAISEYGRLESEDDELVGWVARRPEQPCDRGPF